jgi:hypothetical protein
MIFSKAHATDLIATIARQSGCALGPHGEPPTPHVWRGARGKARRGRSTRAGLGAIADAFVHILGARPGHFG